MNDLQKRFKDMVSVYIVADDNLQESMIDEKVDEVRYIPLFAALSEE